VLPAVVPGVVVLRVAPVRVLPVVLLLAAVLLAVVPPAVVLRVVPVRVLPVVLLAAVLLAAVLLLAVVPPTVVLRVAPVRVLPAVVLSVVPRVAVSPAVLLPASPREWRALPSLLLPFHRKAAQPPRGAALRSSKRLAIPAFPRSAISASRRLSPVSGSSSALPAVATLRSPWTANRQRWMRQGLSLWT
jgi:hypothetical protein